MFIQKSHLTLACAAALFAFTNGAMMASAYAADQGTQAVAPCLWGQLLQRPIGLQVWKPRVQGPKFVQGPGFQGPDGATVQRSARIHHGEVSRPGFQSASWAG